MGGQTRGLPPNKYIDYDRGLLQKQKCGKLDVAADLIFVWLFSLSLAFLGMDRALPID